MSERWQQVKEILQLALEYPPNEREQFLNKVCGDDKLLRCEVKNLLASSESIGDFMEQAAIGKVAEMFVGTEENSLQMAELEFDEEALRAIKTEIDKYVRQKDSLSQKPFEEGLRVIYGRASQYAPLIIRAYQARQVAPALGIYQAMIESEYHDCFVNQIGSVGLFQFAPKTAEKYGLTLKDYCNVEKQSDAAAHYMSDLSSDFVNGNSSATLGLLGFVIGENRVRDYLRQLRGRGVAERSFWTIFRHRQDLQPPLTDDGKIYVPHFFAAAIIGETPEVFELSTPPLTTLSEKGK